MSLIFGVIPDVIFLTFFINYAKGKEEKRLLVFLLTIIAYIICFTVQRFNLLYYTLSVGIIYLIYKAIYKDSMRMIDIVVITVAEMYILTSSFISFKIFENKMEYYYLALLLDKILILLPLTLKKTINRVYKRYEELWDRRIINNRFMKSITVRNLSIVGLCIAFVALYNHLLII